MRHGRCYDDNHEDRAPNEHSVPRVAWRHLVATQLSVAMTQLLAVFLRLIDDVARNSWAIWLVLRIFPRFWLVRFRAAGIVHFRKHYIKCFAEKSFCFFKWLFSINNLKIKKNEYKLYTNIKLMFNNWF